MLAATDSEGKPTDWQNEWNKALSRWFFLGLTVLMLFWLKSRSQLIGPRWAMLAFVGGALIMAGLIHLLLWRGICPVGFKFVTIIIDQTFVSILVLMSGGNVSMFFPAYYIVLFSNAARYGMGMGLYTALTFNVTYVVMLWQQHHPVAPTEMPAEGVRILFYWAVAVYMGFVSSRFHRLARVVEAHESKIRELRRELRSKQP